MKSVLISIQPKWVEKIASGENTIEVRKTRPKWETPFKCYIYCTKGFKFKDFKFSTKFQENYNRQGKVVGEFVCDRVIEWKYLPDHTDENEYEYYIVSKDGYATCLTYDEIENYGQGKTLYGWPISNLVIYDKPKELSEFKKPCDRFLDCITCKRLVRNDFLSCDNKITRPPQSWCYVEKNKNEQATEL